MDESERIEKILKIREMVKERDEARTNGNYAKSDRLRDILSEKHNVMVIDQKDGPSGWKFKDGSSSKIPPGTKLPSKPKESTDTNNNTSSNANNNRNKSSKRGRDDEDAEPASKKQKKESASQQQPAKKPAAAPKPPSAEQERNRSLIQQLVGGGNNSGKRTVNGVIIEELQRGNGNVAKLGDRIKVFYVGRLKSNGKVFDSSTKKPFSFILGRGEVISGWDIGCQGMQVGGVRRLTIPPEKAYGKQGAPPTIPPNATLIFEVTLLKTT